MFFNGFFLIEQFLTMFRYEFLLRLLEYNHVNKHEIVFKTEVLL